MWGEGAGDECRGGLRRASTTTRMAFVGGEKDRHKGDCGGAGTRNMIQLTRLNNQPLIVNCDLIKFIEKSPDTVLSLVTGEKIVVRETSEEVLQKIVTFRQAVLLGLTLQSAGVAATVGAVGPSLAAASLESGKQS